MSASTQNDPWLAVIEALSKLDADLSGCTPSMLVGELNALGWGIVKTKNMSPVVSGSVKWEEGQPTFVDLTLASGQRIVGSVS